MQPKTKPIEVIVDPKTGAIVDTAEPIVKGRLAQTHTYVEKQRGKKEHRRHRNLQEHREQNRM